MKIPVEFEYKGKMRKGYLSGVFGSGTNHFHLMVDNFYWGQFFHSEHSGWQFYNQKETMKELTDYFADVVVAWYQ